MKTGNLLHSAPADAADTDGLAVFSVAFSDGGCHGIQEQAGGAVNDTMRWVHVFVEGRRPFKVRTIL